VNSSDPRTGDDQEEAGVDREKVEDTDANLPFLPHHAAATQRPQRGLREFPGTGSANPGRPSFSRKISRDPVPLPGGLPEALQVDGEGVGRRAVREGSLGCVVLYSTGGETGE
jgi:hypothetical protein